MSSYEIARDRLESLRQRGLLDNPGPARSQPLIRQPPTLRPQPEQYGNTYSQAHEYPPSHNHPPARAPLLGRRPAPPSAGFAEYEEDQYENSYNPPEKRPLLEYDPNSERGFHETGRGFGRGRGLLSRGQGQHYSRGRGGISHSIVNQQADEYEGFDSVGYGLDSTVSRNENRGRGIIRGRGVNMRGRGGDTLVRGIGAGIRGIDTRGRGVNTRGRGVDTIGRGIDTIEGIDVPGRGFGASSRGFDTRGRGLDTRGRVIDTRGRGIDTRGRGVDTRGRSVDTRGRGIDTRGRGIDTRGRGIDTRGRGVDTRGRGIDTRGRSVDTRGRGIDTRGRGIDMRGRGIDTLGRGTDTIEGIDVPGRGLEANGKGIDTRGRGFDTRGRGMDTRGRGVDTRGRGFDTRGRGIDTRGRGVDTRGRGFDTRGRGVDTRGRGIDTRGRGVDTRGRGFDTRGRGFDTRGRGFDTRGRGFDTRGRGFDRGRGISVRGKGTSNLFAGGGHAEESENLYTGNEEAKNKSDSSSKNVSVEPRTSVVKQDSTPSKTGTTEEKVQQKEENENTLIQTMHTPESVKPVTSKTPVQAKAGLGRGLAACLMNVAESSPGCKKDDESSSGGVDHKESSNTNKADGVDNSNKQPSTPDASSKSLSGPSTQVSPLNKELVNSYCEPCKSFFSFASQYQSHLKSEAHISKVTKSAAPDVDIVAKVKQSAEQTLVKHNQSKAMSALKPAGRDRPSGQGDNDEDSDSDGDDTRCKVCDMTFDDRGKYLRHTKGLMHTQKKIEYDKAKGSTKYDDVKETTSDKPFAFGSGSSGKEKPWLRNQSQGYQSHTGYGAQKSHQFQKGYNAHTGHEAHGGYGDNTEYEAYTGYGAASGYGADKGYGQTDEWWENEEHEQRSAGGPAGMTRRLREAGITEEMLAESQMTIPKLDPGDRDLQPGDVGRLQFPDSYHCKLCDAKCTSAVTFQSHLAGAKHKNNVLSASKGNKIKIKKKGRSVTSLTKTSKIEELLSDYSIGECAVIGLDYITEFHTQDPRATILCVCNLCESKCDENTVASHVMGLKHKIKYMKEKHPVMYEHFKKFGGKKSQQTAFAEELAVQVMKQDGRGRVNVKVEVESDEEETPEYKAQKEAEAAKTKEEELVLKQRLQQQMNQAIKRYAVPTMESIVKKHTGPGTEGTSHQKEEDYSGGYQGHPREHDSGHEHVPARGRGNYPQDDRSHDLERGRYDNYPREHERIGGREARWPYDRDHPRGQGYPGYDARSRSPYMPPYQPKPQIDVMERRRLDDLVRRGLITEEERKNMEQTKIAEMGKVAMKKHAESRPGPAPSQQTPGVGPSHRDNPEYLQFLADRQRKQEQKETLGTGHHPQEPKGVMGSEHQTFSGNRGQQLDRKQTTKAKQEEAVPQIGELLSTLSSSMISSEDEAAVALQVSNALTQALLSYRLRASAAEVKKAGINVPSGFPQESGSPGQGVQTSQSTGPAGFTQSANPHYFSSPGPGNTHHPPHTAASGHEGYGIPPANARYDSQQHPKAYSHIQPVPTSEYQASIQSSGYQADSVAQPDPVQPSSQIPGHIQPRLPAHIQPSGVVQPSSLIPGHIQPRLPAHIQPSGAYQPQPTQQPGPVQPPTSTQSKLPAHIQTSTANLPSFGAQLPGHIQPSSSYQPHPIHQSGSSPIQAQFPGHIQQPGAPRLPGHIQPSGLFQPPAAGRGVQYPPMGQYSNFQPPLPSYEPPKPPPPPPPPK